MEIMSQFNNIQVFLSVSEENFVIAMGKHLTMGKNTRNQYCASFLQ
jgi:hypothetical protein